MMTKPVTKYQPRPQPGWSVDITIAGLVFTRRWASSEDAIPAFRALASKAASGKLDRVVLWNGSSCVDVAVPGSGGLGRAPTTAGLEMLMGSQGMMPQQIKHAPVPPGTAIADLQRVCHCGKPVHEFMEKCPGCPGPMGAGKVLRAPGARSATTASAEELGL